MITLKSFSTYLLIVVLFLFSFHATFAAAGIRQAVGLPVSGMGEASAGAKVQKDKTAKKKWRDVAPARVSAISRAEEFNLTNVFFSVLGCSLILLVLWGVVRMVIGVLSGNVFWIVMALLTLLSYLPKVLRRVLHTKRK